MTRFIVPALLMTGLVACTNAPAEEGPKPILREEFAEEFTTAFCDAWEACDCAEGMQVPGLFDENCQTRAATRMERWLSSLEEEGRIYDAECAQSWIESIAQAGCTSFHPEPTCEIVMGTADWSESCERTEDCTDSSVRVSAADVGA